MVSRMVPVIPDEIRNKDPLFIIGEEYALLPVDKKGFLGDIPRIKGMQPYDSGRLSGEKIVHSQYRTLNVCLFGVFKGI